ncbi:C40 family peptidase [Paenibacillus sp. P26]|nr:C40 family peptidase [Paenibacillus sp. P26]
MSAGKKYLGTPYEYASSRSNTNTFDCSDFVRQAFKDALGITLPSDSRGQASYVKAKGNITTDWHNLKPGDLMFFMDYKGTKASAYPADKSNQRISHVGIYLGNGQILHTYSKTSGGVRIDSIAGKHWEYRFVFRRKRPVKTLSHPVSGGFHLLIMCQMGNRGVRALGYPLPVAVVCRKY